VTCLWTEEPSMRAGRAGLGILFLSVFSAWADESKPRTLLYPDKTTGSIGG